MDVEYIILETVIVVFMKSFYVQHSLRWDAAERRTRRPI